MPDGTRRRGVHRKASRPVSALPSTGRRIFGLPVPQALVEFHSHFGEQPLGELEFGDPAAGLLAFAGEFRLGPGYGRVIPLDKRFPPPWGCSGWADCAGSPVPVVRGSPRPAWTTARAGWPSPA